ncbi:MAG: ATP-binding protein, partial [Clostridia bacterium]|nr:ATP-binding protein [Clostridia bacterium]
MEAIKNLMEVNLQSSSKIEVQEDEYVKDDVIYCNKCDTPRTTVVEVLGNKRVVRCICKCQAEARDKDEAMRKEIEKQVRLAKLQEASLLSNRYKHVTFDNCKTGDNKSFDEAFIRCKRFCENSNEVLENGFGIYLYGDKGTGKTHLTSCMANELIKQYKQVLFT